MLESLSRLEIIERYVDGRAHGVYFMDKETNKTYSVEVLYYIGGWNFVNYSYNKRGIYLSVLPVVRRNGWKQFTAFTGCRLFLCEQDRFNKKVLEAYAKEYLAEIETNETVQDLFARVNGN